MATLPRTFSSRNKGNTTFPFSTSPRKLQEVTLPVLDGHGISTSSGVSLKQYEEELSGLRKENFHLKLRVYFLEEKLGSGSPPAVQGLLEHNVRLQVEVEELRRQLTEKQELLAAAAEAINVLEQQGSISTDSVEGSMNISATVKPETHYSNQEQDNEKIEQTGEDTCQETELIGESMGISVTNDESNDLTRLRQENRKALQMIKGCFKKIQQQEKDLKKLRKRNDMGATNSDQALEKYEEILKCKDEHIKDLEHRVKELQKNVDNSNDDTASNLQELLTRRLQGLAYFLDKLLSHKCVLGEDKKKLAESILEQSLALPVGLKLDESMAPEDFTMDESNLDMSHSLRIEDLTMMFGHHVSCCDSARLSARRPARVVRSAALDALSDSECWSEPDRNVSLARMGLGDAPPAAADALDAARHRPRRSRPPQGSRTDDVKNDTEALFLEEIGRLNRLVERLEETERDLSAELAAASERLVGTTAERDDAIAALAAERARAEETERAAESREREASLLASRARELEARATAAAESADKLRAERREAEAAFAETERALRRAADEATVQASQAALERARAHHERLRLERELQEARDELAAALDDNSRLQLELAERIAPGPDDDRLVRGPPSLEEERPTSPDQGIDSDRLSSLEHNDALARSPRSLYEENVSLKQKLSRTKATLADTLAQLNAANMRKRSVQRAICREIHKTHGVLRKARDQLEHQNDDCK